MQKQKIWLATCLIAGVLSTPVVAQPQMMSDKGCGMADGSGMDPSWRQNMRQQRQQALHAQLKLQPSQEAAWKAFVESMPMKVNLRTPAPAASGSAIDRQAFMLEVMKQRQEAMQKHFDASKALYEQLSATQKQTFDHFMRPQIMMKKGMGMGGGK